MNTTGTGTRPPATTANTPTTDATTTSPSGGTADGTAGGHAAQNPDPSPREGPETGGNGGASTGKDTGARGLGGELSGAAGRSRTGAGSTGGGPGEPSAGREPGERTWELSPGAAAAARARALTRRTLDEWRVTGPGDADDIVLIVDELVTNAVVHGAGPVRLTLRRDGPPGRRRITGDVHDDGARVPADPPAPPTRAQAPDWSEAGRGLLLVAALATAHGTSPDPTGKPGKTVWFACLLAPALTPPPDQTA